jgi:hypothetical protein
VQALLIFLLVWGGFTALLIVTASFLVRFVRQTISAPDQLLPLMLSGFVLGLLWLFWTKLVDTFGRG